jgi:inorganic pyrophosphatase
MVLNEAPLFAGCLVLVHLIGVIRAKQTERGKTIRNDRLLGVIEDAGETSPSFVT